MKQLTVLLLPPGEGAKFITGLIIPDKVTTTPLHPHLPGIYRYLFGLYLSTSSLQLCLHFHFILPCHQDGVLVVTIFFHGHLLQTSGFRSAKQKLIFIGIFCFTCWARILSDCNIFCTLRGEKTMAGSNAPGAFLVKP